MNVLRITKKKFKQIVDLKAHLVNADKAVLCMCDSCNGVGFAYDVGQIDDAGYVKGSMNCPCGGRNMKVDKVELIAE